MAVSTQDTGRSPEPIEHSNIHCQVPLAVRQWRDLGCDTNWTPRSTCDLMPSRNLLAPFLVEGTHFNVGWHTQD